MTQLPAVINQMLITKFKMMAVIGTRDIFVELDMIGEELRKICFSKFPLNDTILFFESSAKSVVCSFVNAF
jgi:hypothetical protein